MFYLRKGIFFGTLAILVSSFPAQLVNAVVIEWESKVEQTTLIELYTSEGCSSCPPADRWLSKLVNAPQLWKEIVPVALHVDYWDYLGWKDPFATSFFSERQQDYKRRSYANTVYTPGFFINGREWRGYFQGAGIPVEIRKDVGRLKVSLSNNILTATFTPRGEPVKPLKLYVATLGFGIPSTIERGENAGKQLFHDFLVLNLQSSLSTPQGPIYQWRTEWHSKKPGTSKRGIAVWITDPYDPTPLQATGGMID